MIFHFILKRLTCKIKSDIVDIHLQTYIHRYAYTYYSLTFMHMHTPYLNENFTNKINIKRDSLSSALAVTQNKYKSNFNFFSFLVFFFVLFFHKKKCIKKKLRAKWYLCSRKLYFISPTQFWNHIFVHQ